MRLGNSSSTQTFCEQATAMDYMAIAITIQAKAPGISCCTDIRQMYSCHTSVYPPDFWGLMSA